MCKKNLLNKIKILDKQIYKISTDKKSVKINTQEYEKKLKKYFLHKDIVFDVTLLGIGNDGHIASLFKNNIYYDHLFRIAVTNKKISLSLRKRLKVKTKFQGVFVSYQRPNWKLKHLQYNKILTFLKNVDSQSQEIILTKNNLILEGATTNILYVINKTIYIPKNGYYSGITLRFFLKHSKRKIIKKNITKVQLKACDEIILVGSGRGAVSLDTIPQIHWHKNSNIVFNEFHKMYKSYISKQIATK